MHTMCLGPRKVSFIERTHPLFRKLLARRVPVSYLDQIMVLMFPVQCISITVHDQGRRQAGVQGVQLNSPPN